MENNIDEPENDADIVKVSEIVDESVEDSDDVEIIYKKENPILKVFLWTLGLTVSAIVLLFVIGFVMGLLDIRPPTLDEQIVNNQVDKIQGKESTEPPSEITKKTEEPHASSENS